jgi:hypothetical protein
MCKKVPQKWSMEPKTFFLIFFYENGLQTQHGKCGRVYRRDVTLGEDACQVRIQGAPQSLAALNGGILALMDWLDVNNVASQMRHFLRKAPGSITIASWKAIKVKRVQ